MNIRSTRRPVNVTTKPAAQPAPKNTSVPASIDGFTPSEQSGGIWDDGRPWEIRNQPAKLISQSEDGKTTVSGFRWGWKEAPEVTDWKPHFQNTTIDASKLKDVHFYVEHFFPAGHSALVFEFEDGAVEGSDGQSSNTMVYSIEARKKEGDQWTWKRGLKKTMGMVHQLMTFEDVKQWVTRRQGASLETRRMKLNDEEKQALLSACLDEAVQDRTGEYYHTTRNSCYSALQRIMNNTLPDKAKPMMSPVTAGLMLRPESFLTSSYNTVLKDMNIFSRENAQLHLPDPELHPEKHVEGVRKGLNSGFVNSMAKGKWFAPTLELAGTAAGLGGGFALGSQALGFGPIGTAIATVGLGYIGNRTASIAGDYMEGNALRTIANADLTLLSDEEREPFR